jgi:hypothetical protein
VTDQNEEARLVAEHVDQAPNMATEPDEQQVLESLGYVLNPVTGVYEGEPDGDQ